jgi:nucleoside-diphosphate-sugar epimerase
MTKKVLITGATGFIGSHLARRLIKDGWQLHAVIRNSSKYDLIKDIKNSVHFHVYNGTIESMQKILAVSQPEIIFHLASLFLSQHKPEDITRLIQSNIVFGSHLVESAVNSGCRQFINTGTSWQHFENNDYNPVNLYAATKQAFEDILKFYVEANGLKVITLKLFDTYGPEDTRPKLLNLLKRAAETGEPLYMSPGEQLIDLVHIDDVVEAFCAAQQFFDKTEGPLMKEYGVTSGNPVSLKEFVLKIENELKKKINVVWSGRPYRNREVMIPWNSMDTVPGWIIKKKKFI